MAQPRPRLVLTNALVIDGTGAPAAPGEVTIEGDRIVHLERRPRPAERPPGPGVEVIDVGGRVVSPGFIDMHTHSDLQVLVNPAHAGRITQGITTELLGQDGLSYAPVDDTTLPIIADRIRGWNDDPPGYDFGWRSVAEYLDRLDAGIACHGAYLVPHGNLRQLVMGTDDTPATTTQLHRMQALLRDGMDAGAFGLSAGLTYVPGMFATTDELVALCEVVAEYDGLYVPHHRNYGSDVIGGFAECFEIARRSGVRLHLAHTHLSYPQNRDKLPALLALFERAAADGVDFSFDAYPYAASMSTLLAQFPSWAQVGTLDDQLAMFSDPVVRERLRQAVDADGSDGHQGFTLDWDTIVIGGVPATATEWQWASGLSVAAIADRLRLAPADAAMDLLVATRFAASCVMFSGIEDHVRALMRHPRHTIGSDGIMVGTKPHPRAFGSFPHFLGNYVRELGVLELPEAIRHITSAPADRLRLADRGRIAAGAVADLVVFDPDTIGSPATYAEPHQFATGIDRVYVLGVEVVADGQVTGARPGRSLRATRPGPDSVETPGLVVDLDRTAANVAATATAAHAAGKSYLPHAKSHRSPALGRLQLDNGADGLCLAKLGEAEAFADALAPDHPDLTIFVAYPVVGDSKARRALALATRINLTLGTDSVAAAASIGAEFAAAGQRCRLFLGIDSGLRREGVAPSDAAAVATEISSLPGVWLDGIYTHEGSVMGATDRDDLRTRSARVAELMANAATAIRDAGVPLTEVSVGCSGSVDHLVDLPGITQVRPGINTFGDMGQVALGNTELDRVSVRVHVTVVSHPEPGRACIDAGTKSIGADLLPAAAHADRYPGHGLLVDAPGWQVAKLSEEHGWLRWVGEGDPPPLPVGTRLELVPNHVCVVFGSLRRWTGVRGDRAIGRYDCLPPGSSE